MYNYVLEKWTHFYLEQNEHILDNWTNERYVTRLTSSNRSYHKLFSMESNSNEKRQ